MTKPIFATPKMDRAESERIYGELRETTPSGDKAKKLDDADGVFARAKQRAQVAMQGRGPDHSR